MMAEKTEWRECVFAGDGHGSMPERFCDHYHKMRSRFQCADCYMPALVDAVRATMRIRAARDLSAICYNEILTAQRLAAAVLAVLPKEESRE